MVTATPPTSRSQALRLTPRPYQYEAVAALARGHGTGGATAAARLAHRDRQDDCVCPPGCNAAAGGP